MTDEITNVYIFFQTRTDSYISQMYADKYTGIGKQFPRRNPAQFGKWSSLSIIKSYRPITSPSIDEMIG